MLRPRFLPALALALSLCGCGTRSAAPPETEAGLRELARSRLSKIEGAIPVSGIAQPVEILRDEWGVAHIYAKNTGDLFFAQGYSAAQDRLYQMEIWRRTGTGELAEVFGPEFVERDRIARLVQYRGDWNAEWQSYSPEARRIAQSFVNGVNAYIRQCGDKLPIEFDLLGFRPGEWKPEHTTLRIAGLLMTRNASNELARAELVAKLGLEKASRFAPPEPLRPLDPPPGLNLAGLDSRVLQGYRAAISIPKLDEQGSNNWVVDGSMTATGRPLLAGDPHRPVVLPSLRYLVHLNAPGWNVIGSGEPALPGVAIGHNERAAWAFTIVPYDQVDLYVEKTDPANPNRYLYKGQWRDVGMARENVPVRDRTQPVQVTLKWTVHGPVIWEDSSQNRIVSLRWTGTEPGTAGYLGSLKLDQVNNFADFREAMRSWKIPSENIIYADRDGHIGWIAAGLVPVRSWSGMFPVPGDSGKYEWSGFRTVEDLPQKYDPPEHFIATANHNILPEGYDKDLAFDWSPPYRYERIAEVLRGGKKFEPGDFQKLQHDETSLPARELVAMLREAPKELTAQIQAERALLENWDGVLGKDSAAAALFEFWFRRIPGRLLREMAPQEERGLIGRNLQAPVWIGMLKEHPKRPVILTDALAGAVTEARQQMGMDRSGWRWGKLHTITFRHPLANSPARRKVFNLGPVGRGGDSYTPNATSGPGFQQANGASYREVIDVGDWDRSTFTSTPGQSGQPGSPYYDDLLPLWANHEYAPLVFSREAVEKATKHRLVLEPVGAPGGGPSSGGAGAH